LHKRYEISLPSPLLQVKSLQHAEFLAVVFGKLIVFCFGMRKVRFAIITSYKEEPVRICRMRYSIQ